MDNALVRADVRDLPAMEAGLDGGYDAIVHLAAHAGERIPMYGDGSTCRDYTYVAGVMAALAYDRSRYEVINLGNDRTITLRAMIDELERVLNVRAEIEQLPDQPGDVGVDRQGTRPGRRPVHGHVREWHDGVDGWFRRRRSLHHPCGQRHHVVLVRPAGGTRSHLEAATGGRGARRRATPRRIPG
jgi:nucleoside-diphosphate-sugar epimerase